MADMLFVVSDGTEAGFRAAKRIICLVRELEIDIKKMMLILNRSKSAPAKERLKDLEIEVAGVIPEDKDVLDLSLQGKPLTYLGEASKSLRQIRKILGKI